MLSSATYTSKTPFLSTPFLPSRPLLHHLHKHLPHPPHSKPTPITALILPSSPSPKPHASSIQDLILPQSSSPSPEQQRQQLYQPFRPPPSPIPPKYRSLDINGRLEVLSNRLGLWFEYAPLIPTLVQEGFISSIIEEITGIAGVEQNQIVVASQVRESLIESGIEEDILSFFDLSGAGILYELRLLSNAQRAAAARFAVLNGFNAKMAQDLAKAIKDMPRRKWENGWDSFNDELPGDCLAFMYYRLAQEHKSASSLDLWRSSLEKAFKVAESEPARKRVLDEKEGTVEEEEEEEAVAVVGAVKVPVVRMKIGEVAEATSVAVLPVSRADGGAVEVEDAPWECGCRGDFGVVEAEKGWSRWVVLPRWEPVAILKRGGVAVAFNDSTILPWKAAKWNRNEAILVVADRGMKEVVADDGFYLVVGGGNGNAEEGLKVERGSALKTSGVKESLGTVVLVIRPPREEYDDQISNEEWD